ncbi:MAG: methyltransferase [Candidatus Caldatribacteriota bacterium]
MGNMCKRTSGQSYISEFLNLRCAGDVLNVCTPLGNNAAKEITETMGVIKVLRDIALKNPRKYVLYDICAGNALTSVLAAHLLPFYRVEAIDKEWRERRWDEVKGFYYTKKDIFKLPFSFFCHESIIISIHPCGKLAKRIIELYNNSFAEYLILMPCCEGSLSGQYQLVEEKMGKYFAWCLELQTKCKGTTSMYRDYNIKSPKNYIIIANKNQVQS